MKYDDTKTLERVLRAEGWIVGVRMYVSGTCMLVVYDPITRQRHILDVEDTSHREFLRKMLSDKKKPSRKVFSTHIIDNGTMRVGPEIEADTLYEAHQKAGSLRVEVTGVFDSRIDAQEIS